MAESFVDRTDVQCLHRWQKVLNPELVKGPWTKEVCMSVCWLSGSVSLSGGIFFDEIGIEHGTEAHLVVLSSFPSRP